LISKNSAQRLLKTHEDLFLGDHTKKGVCGRKFVGKSRTKTFWASLGKFGQKSFVAKISSKIFLLLHFQKRAIFGYTQRLN